MRKDNLGLFVGIPCSEYLDEMLSVVHFYNVGIRVTFSLGPKAAVDINPRKIYNNRDYY